MSRSRFWSSRNSRSVLQSRGFGLRLLVCVLMITAGSAAIADGAGAATTYRHPVRTRTVKKRIHRVRTSSVKRRSTKRASTRRRGQLGMRYVRSPYPGRGTAPSMEAAISAVFPATLHAQALNVAWCESKGRASARNGQYRGHFQIGRTEWRRFGAGNPFNAVDNTRAAYRYYLAVGSWRPWQCQP